MNPYEEPPASGDVIEDRRTGELYPGPVDGRAYDLRSVEDGNWQGLAEQVNLFMVHHSVTYRSHATHTGLQARGYSVTFLLDDDDQGGFATIHQTLDMREIAFHAAGINQRSLGVEIALMPQAWQNPNLYSQAAQKRHGVTPHKITEDHINGQRFRCFRPTDAQLRSLVHLIWGVGMILPDLPRTFPRETDGSYARRPLKDVDKYRGLINHYNASKTGKVDCLGIDHEWVEREVAGLG